MNHEQLLAILALATAILFLIVGSSFDAEEQTISPFINLEIIMVLFSIISKSIWFALLIPIAACGTAVCFGVFLFLANDKIYKLLVKLFRKVKDDEQKETVQ